MIQFEKNKFTKKSKNDEFMSSQFGIYFGFTVLYYIK
jgi:hypothetical protein